MSDIIEIEGRQGPQGPPLNVAQLPDTAAVGLADELVVQQSGTLKRVTTKEVFDSIVPALPDATSVGTGDEVILHQGGVAKRATANELVVGALSVPSLPDATTVYRNDELLVQQGGTLKRATSAELVDNAIPQLTAATTVNPSDELMLQQSGTTKRVTAEKILDTALGNVASVGLADEFIVDQSGTMKRATTKQIFDSTIPALPNASTINKDNDEILIHQNSEARRLTAGELFNSITPQLADATSVGTNDEIIVHQSGVAKRATASELAAGLVPLTSVTATGSTTPRFLGDRFGERVNVKDFGAIGNGIANDTPAIAAAAAALPNGGVIYFPAGTYLKDSNSTGFSNISFEGEHHSRSIIKARAQATITSDLLKSTGNNLYCRNLTLDCNWQNLRVHNGKISAIVLIGDNSCIQECRVINFGGCAQTSQEAFPVVAQGNHCIITRNIVEQPVPGLTSANVVENNPYCTFVNVFGTGAQAVVPITSSNATNNTITITNTSLQNGDKIMFTALSGGSPLQINTVYYVIEKNLFTFKVSTSPNGSPVDFATINSANVGSVSVGGTGIISGNYLRGTFTEGMQTNYGLPNSYGDLTFGIVGGSTFDTLIVKDNYCCNLGAGFNGDSWHNGTLIIDSNYFKNCQRSINLTYYGNSPDPRLRVGYIRNNVIRTTANAFPGGSAGRFENIDNMFVENNYVDTWDDSFAVEGCFYFKNMKQAVVKNNVFHTNVGMGNCIDTGVLSWIDENNTDQNGIQRFEYSIRTNNVVVDGNKSASQNGLALGRAVLAARNAQPNYAALSATNRFVINIKPGNYDLAGYVSSLVCDFDNAGHISLVGLGDNSAARITHSSAPVINITPNSPNITIANLTLVAANGQVALSQSSNTSCVFDNVIFDKVGNGAIVPEGQFQHRGKFIRCRSVHPFHAATNLQGNFGGECHDCQWLGGFSTVPIAGTSPVLRNTIIVGRVFTLDHVSGLTMEDCRVYAAAGTANQNILLGENCLIANCVFKNSRLVVSGGNNEIYNCTLNIDAGQNDCISEAAGQSAAIKVFNVGSNKPVHADVTVTRLTAL